MEVKEFLDWYIQNKLGKGKFDFNERESLRQLAGFSSQVVGELGFCLATGSKSQEFNSTCDKLKEVFTYFDKDKNFLRTNLQWYEKYLPRWVVLCEFTGGIQDNRQKCRKAGLKIIITSGVNSKTNRLILKIQEKYPDIVKVSFGIYPIDALNKEIDSGEASGFIRDTENINIDQELQWIEKNKDKCVAIGECGLDYKWSTDEKEHEQQKQIFEKVINLAKKLNKPLIIHSRKAELEALDLLEKSKAKKVILHCFSGSKNLIKRGIELGYYFSIPPIITRLQHFQMLAELVPLSQLLTETDAPYLSSIQGERNEPANVKVTIKEIARIKNLDESKVEEEIFKNCKKLFEF